MPLCMDENTIYHSNLEVNKKLLESLARYRKMMNYMSADIPIESLCLPKKLERLLIKSGLQRVFELFDLEITKIEGLDDVACRHLTARLNEFFPMCF